MTGLVRWIPAVGLMAAIFVASSLPASAIPFFGPFDYFIKKLGHAVGFGMLGVAYYYALPPGVPRGVRWLLAWVMSFVWAVTDELHQYYVAGRTSSAVDVGIDLYGATLFLIWGAGWEIRWRGTQSRGSSESVGAYAENSSPRSS